MYSYWQRYSLSCGFTGRSGFKTFLFVKFVDLLEKNCVSYSELSVPFRYDGRFSSNVKSSPQWSAWLSGISQRLERTIGILKFFSVFIKQGNQNREGKNCGPYTFYRWAIGGTLLRRSFSFTKIAFIHDFIRSSHVWFSYIHSYSYIHGCIWNKHNEHFPVSLVAQLMEPEFFSF